MEITDRQVTVEVMVEFFLPSDMRVAINPDAQKAKEIKALKVRSCFLADF